MEFFYSFSLYIHIAHRQACRNWGPSLWHQLTLCQLGGWGYIMPTTLIRAPPPPPKKKTELVTALIGHSFNPKGGGGGPKVPAGQEIACHFSQDHAMVTKILDFIHKHLN